MAREQLNNGSLATTSGVVELLNLEARIAGQQDRVAAGLVSIAEQAELIELVALRGNVLGRVADYERALDHAEDLCRLYPEVGAAFLARARSRGRLHLFEGALNDLDEAQRLCVDRDVVVWERAGCWQAIGQYEHAQRVFADNVRRRGDFESLAAMAVLEAELGQLSPAERLFAEAENQYRGVSPIPLALLGFQRGHMWLLHGDLDRAHARFVEACRLLPCYASANGHLAEVEAARGLTQPAIDRLCRLASSSDDPDYPAALARILTQVGRVEEASGWCAKAAARYEELVLRHGEAFADHAAGFLLDFGLDPFRALSLAKKNLAVRSTAHALRLYERATRAWSEARASKDGMTEVPAS